MYQKLVLKNGLRLVLAPQSETESVALWVLFGVGSRYEKKREAGLSHFTEHMMFKGTKKRPDTMAISREVDGVGAEFNAYTGKEYTGYCIKVIAKHLDLATDVFSDMLLHSKFDAAEIEKEKGVITEEINMYEDNPAMYIDDLLEQTMFTPNFLGRSVAGSRQTVKKMTRRDFLDFYHRFYGGRNAVICLAGKFTSRDIACLGKKFSLTPGRVETRFASFKIKQQKPRVALKFKAMEQVQLAFGFPAYAYTHSGLYALQLLSVILGGNMSSRLFIRVREKNGLAYSIHSGLDAYRDTGSLTILAGLDKSRVALAIKIILAELEKIKNGVSGDELSRAKEYLIGQMALNLEDSQYLAKKMAHQEMFLGRTLTAKEEQEKFLKVTHAQVATAAKQIIRRQRMSLAVIGPFEEAAYFMKLIA